MRVMTWNIHGCVGRSGFADPEQTMRVVRAVNPDVLALQEVDSMDRRGGGDLFGYFARFAGGYAFDSKSITTADGHYGQMLISRWPLEDVRVHDISVAAREARHVIEARVETPLGHVRVLATHLGLNRAERRHQLSQLGEIVKSGPIGMRLLLGDFNEWRGRGYSRTILTPLFDAVTSLRSYPAALPLWALDRIWIHPGSLLRHAWVERTARRVSDHLPVVVDLARLLDRSRP